MLMCALLLPIAHETAGAARIRHSLRPVFGGGKFPANLGRNAPRECKHTFSCPRPRRRTIQYSRGTDNRTGKPRRTGSSAFADDDKGGRVAPPPDRLTFRFHRQQMRRTTAPEKNHG